MQFLQKRRSALTIIILSTLIAMWLIVYGINNIDYSEWKKQARLNSAKFYTIIPSDITDNTPKHYVFLKKNLWKIDNMFVFIKNDDMSSATSLPENWYYCSSEDCIKWKVFPFWEGVGEHVLLDKLFTKREDKIYDVNSESVLNKHIYFLKNNFPEIKSLYVIYLNNNLEDSKQNSIVNDIEKLYIKWENNLHIVLSNATQWVTDSIWNFIDFNTTEILWGYIDSNYILDKDLNKKQESKKNQENKKDLNKNKVNLEKKEKKNKKEIKKIERVTLAKDTKINMECSSCVSILDKLANNAWKNFFTIKDRYSKQDRDSLLIGAKNKSYIFWFFTKENRGENYNIINKIVNTDNITENKDINLDKETSKSNDINSDYISWIFFWDAHFTRWFTYFLDKWRTTKDDYFKCFYNSDWQTNLLSWLDIVWINLETSVANTHECTTSYKEIKFRTEPNFLWDFKWMWINTFNIANNHSYDCWNVWYTATKVHLDESWLNYFWDWRWKESVILKRNIRWKKIAFIGLNTTTYSIDYEDKFNKVRELKKEWFIVIVNIHWWSEYKIKHNDFQENFAYKLVEAWANLIIWHHPHVVQDFEIYKWTPIYYSLWNFIFDQPFDETLKGMWVLFSINNDSIITKEIYFTRNPVTYQIQCSSIR